MVGVLEHVIEGVTSVGNVTDCVHEGVIVSVHVGVGVKLGVGVFLGVRVAVIVPVHV